MHGFRNRPLDEPSTNTTSTTLAKIRGFTLTLMEAMGTHEHRVKELADFTERQPAYVRRYLHNLRRYGLAQQNRGFWSLTQRGVDMLCYLIDSKDIRERNVKEERKKRERNVKVESKIDEFKLLSNDRTPARRNGVGRGSSVGKRTRRNHRWWRARRIGQHFLDKFMGDNYDLEEKDLLLVRYLWRHYQRYGQQFVFLSQVELDIVRMGIRREELTGALQRLSQYNVIYVVRGNKIGLKVPFIEQLVGVSP